MWSLRVAPQDFEFTDFVSFALTAIGFALMLYAALGT